MEEDKATLSLEVYKQAEEENEIDSVERGDNMDTVSMELELSATRETEPCDLNLRAYLE